MIPITYVLESAYYGRFCFAPLYSTHSPLASRQFSVTFTGHYPHGALPYYVCMTSRQGNHNYIFEHNKSGHEHIPLDQARKIWCHLVTEGWKPL